MTTWTKQLEYATNLIPYSENIERGIWTVNSAVYLSIENNIAISPFGDLTATRLTDLSDSEYGLAYYAVALSGGVTRTASIFVKKDDDNSRYVSLQMRYGSPAKISSISARTDTGAISSYSDTAVETVDYGIEDYNTYWRIWTASRSSTLDFASYMILPAAGAVLGSGASVTTTGSAIVFGCQLEVGSEPTGYIYTNGAEVTVEKRTEWASQ